MKIRIWFSGLLLINISSLFGMKEFIEKRYTDPQDVTYFNACLQTFTYTSQTNEQKELVGALKTEYDAYQHMKSNLDAITKMLAKNHIPYDDKAEDGYKDSYTKDKAQLSAAQVNIATIIHNKQIAFTQYYKDQDLVFLTYRSLCRGSYDNVVPLLNTFKEITPGFLKSRGPHTLLRLAVKEKSSNELIEWWLKNNANPNYQNISGNIPLYEKHYACSVTLTEYKHYESPGYSFWSLAHPLQCVLENITADNNRDEAFMQYSKTIFALLKQYGARLHTDYYLSTLKENSTVYNRLPRAYIAINDDNLIQEAKEDATLADALHACTKDVDVSSGHFTRITDDPYYKNMAAKINNLIWPYTSNGHYLARKVAASLKQKLSHSSSSSARNTVEYTDL